MFHRLISGALPQYKVIAALSVRDTGTVAATAALLCAVCWYLGHPIVALSIGAGIFVTETALRLMFKRVGPFHSLTRHQSLQAALALHLINTVLYTTPTLVLAANPSVAIKIAAVIAIVGAQVYVTNAWSRVTTFIVALMMPLVIMMVLMFFQLSATPPEVSPASHWAFATGFLLVFVFMVFDTLRQHIAAETELSAAQKEAAHRLSQLEESHRLDALTGLLNRTAFDKALAVMLDDRSTTGGEITVFLVDLDSFKPINDTYSHEAGDAVLRATAQRLTTLIGQSGLVGRLGGDEFICAVHDLSGAEEVLGYGRDICKTIARPIDWNERRLKITASIGAATTALGQLVSVQSLCSAADQAMFAAKSSPNRIPVLYEPHLFAPRMTAQDKQRLIDGIADQTVRPFYQPKIHLPTGDIIGFEALARWDHGTDELRLPTDFVDQINDLGLQGDFMMSMARQVVRDINTLLVAGLDPGQVSLNVSEVALATHSGHQELHSIISSNPEAAKHLTFEITEDVFIARAADTIQTSITSFRDLGVRVSLDDFGTGFASFHHLRQLDFDELKIDTSFVAGLGHDPTAEVLVRGFLDMASGLGVSVIAEGVETEAQSRDLMNMGCLTAQGFLFSAAVPFEQARTQLQDQQAA